MKSNCTPFSKAQWFFAQFGCPNCFSVEDDARSKEGPSGRDCRPQVNSALGNMVVE